MRRMALPWVYVLLGVVLARAWPGGGTAQGAPVAGTVGLPDFAAVVEAADAGVVHVHNYLQRPRDVVDPSDPDAVKDNVGSGFVYSADGLVVTSRHVVEGAATLLVEVAGHGRLPARVVGVDRVVDVALLQVDARGLHPLVVGDPQRLRVGQWVLAAGSPYRLPHSWSAGVVSGLHRSDVGVNVEGYEDFVQTDAAVNLGNSGGPLLDGTGRVVGLTTGILSRSGGSQGVAFAVPIDVVVQTVEALRTHGRVRRNSMGVVVRAAAPRTSSSLPGGGGVEVVRFQEESAGRRAGLREGDVILRVDGVPVPSKGLLQRTLWSRAAGASVQVTYWRDGTTRTASCTLEER